MVGVLVSNVIVKRTECIGVGVVPREVLPQLPRATGLSAVFSWDTAVAEAWGILAVADIGPGCGAWMQFLTFPPSPVKNCLVCAGDLLLTPGSELQSMVWRGFFR